MTLLLVILLVVYFAAVSAPFSPRLVGLLLARNGLRELPLLGTSTVVRSASPKAAPTQPLNGSDATAARSFGTRMRISREEDHEQAIVYSTREKAGHLSVQQGQLCRQCPFPHARSEWLRR
jgi:hypothetical protein